MPGGVGLIEIDWIGLRAGPGGSGGVLIGRQARVNPLRALARLAATVPLIAAGTTARSVKIKGSRVVTVATTAGDIHPGAVVFATGVPPLLDWPGRTQVSVDQGMVRGAAGSIGIIRHPGYDSMLAARGEGCLGTGEAQLAGTGRAHPASSPCPPPRTAEIMAWWGSRRWSSSPGPGRGTSI